jgi:hemerythrin-like domain-containing protein
MLEEQYIFPLFEKQNKKTRLVKTLRNQHTKGRAVTARLKEIASLRNPLDDKTQHEIKSLLKKFITMYRPHETREDTELFPQVRSLISEKEFKELGETFEKTEHKLFEGGFQAIVNKVEEIEKSLGIYQLEQFTPKINEK